MDESGQGLGGGLLTTVGFNGGLDFSSFSDVCGQNEKLIGTIALVLAYMVFEFWLGRTSKTKSASLLELFLRVSFGVALFFINRRKKDVDAQKRD